MTAGREQDARETLRALSEAATPGPWERAGQQTVKAASGYLLAGAASTADAEFIAAAVNYVRAALLPSPPATTGAAHDTDWYREQHALWTAAHGRAYVDGFEDGHVSAHAEPPPATTGAGDEVWAQNEWENGGRWMTRPIGAPSSPPATDGDAARGVVVNGIRACGAGTGGGEVCWLPLGHVEPHDPDAPDPIPVGDAAARRATCPTCRGKGTLRVTDGSDCAHPLGDACGCPVGESCDCGASNCHAPPPYRPVGDAFTEADAAASRYFGGYHDPSADDYDLDAPATDGDAADGCPTCGGIHRHGGDCHGEGKPARDTETETR